MQYLLSEEERAALVSADVLEKSQAAVKALRLMVVGDKCVHDRSGNPRWRYCDQCPLSHIGHDATVKDRDLSRAMCDLPREYSK